MTNEERARQLADSGDWIWTEMRGDTSTHSARLVRRVDIDALATLIAAALDAADQRYDPLLRAVARYMELASACEYIGGEPEVCPGVAANDLECHHCELRHALGAVGNV